MSARCRGVRLVRPNHTNDFIITHYKSAGGEFDFGQAVAVVLAVELETGGGVVTHDADGRALAVVRLMLVGYVEVGDAVTVVKIKTPLIQDKLDVARGIDVTVEVDVCHLKTVMVDIGRLL